MSETIRDMDDAFEENMALRRELAETRRKVAELTAENNNYIAENDTVPHEVVDISIDKGVSLMEAWKIHHATYPGMCKWHYDERVDTYHTDCDMVHGTIGDFEFCPHCGGKIEVNNARGG